MNSLKLLIPDATLQSFADYRRSLIEGSMVAGGRLQEVLEGVDLESADDSALLTALLRSKKPQIFAESAVVGDGSDWNALELRLLGDISVAMDVIIFDDGRHASPAVHAEPFGGTLIFTPGALLRASGRGVPADWVEIVGEDGELDAEAYDGLYERRLLPVFQYVESHCRDAGGIGLVTIPGLGCGQFAGRFQGQLGVALERALGKILEAHAGEFPHVKAVFYDAYSECDPSRKEIGGVEFMIRPLLGSGGGKAQLCRPVAYQESGDDFSNCRLFSVVAWDHVSWPGNDFFGGSRCTDDGVKAAATNSMEVLTGVAGCYSEERFAYLPPSPFRTWGEVVAAKELDPRIWAGMLGEL